VDPARAGVLAVIGPETADPGDEIRDRIGHSLAGTVRPRVTSAPASGVRDPCQARARPTATSIFATGISR